MAHVVAPDLPRGIRQSVREHRRGGVEQQPRALDGVRRHRDHPRLLALLLAVLVDVDDARHPTGVVMLDPQGHRAGPQLVVAGVHRPRHVGIGRRPLRPPLAALEAEAGLLARHPVVVVDRVDRHVSGVDALVADLLRTGLEDLVVVVPRQAGQVAGAGDAHLGLGLVVPRRHLGPVDRPVEQVRALHGTVVGQRLPLVILEAQAGAGEMRRRAADRLDDPRRQVGEVARHPPRPGGGAHVEPGELGEAFPLVVDEVLGLVVAAGFEGDDGDALLRQSVAEHAAAGTGADDDDDRVVVEVKGCSHDPRSYSQAMSLKPRSM